MRGASVADGVRGAVLAVYWGLLFTATHLPKIPEALEPGVSDKWMHTAAYGGLAFLLALVWTNWKGGGGHLRWNQAAKVLAVCAVYGVVDEVLQGFVSRQPDVRDWVADIGGSVLGLAVFGVVTVCWRFCKAVG